MTKRHFMPQDGMDTSEQTSLDKGKEAAADRLDNASDWDQVRAVEKLNFQEQKDAVMDAGGNVESMGEVLKNEREMNKTIDQLERNATQTDNPEQP